MSRPLAAACAILLCAFLPVTSAGAAEESACSLSAQSLESPDVTGPPYQFDGTVTATAASDAGAPTVRCDVKVDGTTVSSVVSTVSGAFAKGSAQQVRFWAWDASAVFELCAWISYDDISYTFLKCEIATVTAFPANEVWDATDPAVDAVWFLKREGLDPWACLVTTQARPGVPGVVDIAEDGDVTAVGVPAYDCPPYGWNDPRVRGWLVTVDATVTA
jgi:hypothetical protein